MNEKYKCDYRDSIDYYDNYEFFNSWDKKNTITKLIDFDFELSLSQKEVSKQLDNFDIKDIENYLRKKKLEKLNTK